MVKKGDIVTVTLERCFLEGHQGEVVEIYEDGHKDGPLEVKFGKELRHLFDFENKEPRTVRFEESDLRVDPDWSLENKVLYFYGKGMWHTVHKLTEPFSRESFCTHRNHGDTETPVVKRIIVNYVGSVCEVDVCEEHVSLEGVCTEDWAFG